MTVNGDIEAVILLNISFFYPKWRKEVIQVLDQLLIGRRRIMTEWYFYFFTLNFFVNLHCIPVFPTSESPLRAEQSILQQKNWNLQLAVHDNCGWLGLVVHHYRLFDAQCWYLKEQGGQYKADIGLYDITLNNTCIITDPSQRPFRY